MTKLVASKFFLVGGLFLLSIVACGTSKKKTERVFPWILESVTDTAAIEKKKSVILPSWLRKPPIDTILIYASGRQIKADLQEALHLAIDSSHRALGHSIFIEAGVIKDSLLAYLQNENSKKNQREILEKVFLSLAQDLRSNLKSQSKIEDQFYHRVSNMWQAYVLTSYPYAALNYLIYNRILENEDLLERFRKTPYFKKMESTYNEYDRAR